MLCCVCGLLDWGEPTRNELKGQTGEKKDDRARFHVARDFDWWGGRHKSHPHSSSDPRSRSRLPYKQCLRVGFHQRSILSRLSHSPGPLYEKEMENIKREREKKMLSLAEKFRSRSLSLSLLIYSAQGQHRPAAAALYLAPPPSILRHSSIFFFLISLFRRHLITWCVGCVTQQQPEEEVLSVYFYFFVFRVKIYFFCFCSLCRESRRRRRRRDFDPNSIMTSST